MAATALATVLLCTGSAQAVALDDMLTISPPADVTVPASMPCGQDYCAQVYFSFTASGGTPPYNFVCGAYPGSLFTVGSHNVGCLAQDSRGNSTPTATFTITVTAFVRDTTPPVFQNVPPIFATADSSGRAVLSYPLPTATDNIDGAVPVHCSPWNGGPDAFPLGTTTATCTATDSQGNTATTTFTITVTQGGTTGGTTTTTTTTTTPATTTPAGTTASTPTTPPPTVTITVTQPATTTSAAPTANEQSLQDQINALSAQIAALTDQLARVEKAGDAAWLAFEQAMAAGATRAEAAVVARGTYLNAEYKLGAFAP
jgi:hypothetical protein